MFQSSVRVGMLHSLSFHLAWASKPIQSILSWGDALSYLQRKGIVQGGSGKIHRHTGKYDIML